MLARRILVVDDNTVVCDLLREFLGGSFLVDIAFNASQGLAAIMDDPPDAILLDVNMPGTDGLTLLGALREKGIKVPVIVMTGYDGPNTAQTAKAKGATAYLTKPVDLRVLDKLIATSLGTAPVIRS